MRLYPRHKYIYIIIYILLYVYIYKYMCVYVPVYQIISSHFKDHRPDSLGSVNPPKRGYLAVGMRYVLFVHP